MSEYFDYDYDPLEFGDDIGITNRYWTDKHGNKYLFKDLETQHLKNILHMLDDRGINVPILLFVELRLREGV